MVLIDCYDVAVDSEGSLTNKHPSATTALSSLGQTFKPTSDFLLTSVKFKMRRSIGSLTGTLKAYLYAHVGTFGVDGRPNGVFLAESTTEFDMSMLTTTLIWYEFLFDGTYVLQANVPYCIVIYSLNGNMTEATYPKIARRNVGTHEGNGILYRSSSWQIYATIDVLFYVFGDVYVPPVIPPTIHGKPTKKLEERILIDYWSNYLDYGTIKAAIRQALEETKPITASIKKSFEETINVKAKIAETFQESMPITASVLREFTETLYVRGDYVRNFWETVSTMSDVMKAVMTDGLKISGEVVSLRTKLKILKRNIRKT